MKLSIIVCTRNRAYTITGCLDSIADSLSNVTAIDSEIVVVDNASEDDTFGVVGKWAESCAFPVKLLLEQRRGVSAAKNCALRAAIGDWLVLTDDDCRLNQNYVRDLLLHAAADTGPVMRGGRVELGDPADMPITIKTSSSPARWQRRTQVTKNANLLDNVEGCNMILGCNLTMNRQAVDRIGFFDEDIGPGMKIPASEDTDYVLRAWLADIPIEYVPDMVIYHFQGRKQASEGKNLLRYYMIGNGALFAKYLFKYPNLCRVFYWDLRHAVKEVVSGKSTFRADTGFSHKHKVYYYMVGAVRYFFLRLKKPFKGSPS